MRRYALRDDQWDRIKDLLPGSEGHVGVTAKDNRLFVEAVLYRYQRRHPVTRSAGTVWPLEGGAYALQPLGREWSVEEGLRAPSRGCRQ